uniref:Vacuolar protein sorting-associated protein 18 homolog n=1 Tax=Mesocestoides corti TaxID=53468 RepID=A0A5K3EUC7_MESCO
MCSSFKKTEICQQSDDRVHNLFVDSRGCHIVISMQSGVNYYTTRKCMKIKQLSKAKDLLIDSVAWNPFNESDTATQEILIGANDGSIFEAVISSSEERLRTTCNTVLWKNLIKLDNSVTGLAVVRYPPGSPLVPVGEPQMCVVFASTPGRLYQFVGRIQSPDLTPSRLYINAQAAATALREGYLPGLYAPVFAAYAQNLSGSKCVEFPGSYGYSDLKLFQKNDEEVPSQFAWMTASGIYFGRLDTTRLLDPVLASSTTDPTATVRISLTSQVKLIPYPTMAGESVGLPLNICLTEFHVIIAFADRVKAVNLLDERAVFSRSTLDALAGAQTGAICRDAASGLLWLHSCKTLCQLTLDHEDTRIWKIHLERDEFNDARKYCKTAEQLDQINCREAEFCFARGDYIRSAELFAETSTPFEEVALRFSQTSVLTSGKGDVEGAPVATGIALTEDYGVDGEHRKFEKEEPEEKENSSTPDAAMPLGLNLQLLTPSIPLKVFLRAKLKLIEKTSDERQAAIVALWLIELLLGEIGVYEDRCGKPCVPLARQEELSSVRGEFRQLITSSVIEKILPNCKDLIYKLLLNHGNHTDLVFFAKNIGDHDRLIDHYMSRGAHTEAVFVFTTHPSCAQKLYQYSAQLASSEPRMLVDALIRAGRRLCPCRLLPSVLLLPSDEAIRYLEFVVDQLQCQEQAIHHQLILLYSGSASPSNDVRLLGYLKRNTSPSLCEVFAGAFDGLNESDNMPQALSSAYSTLEPALPYDPGFAIRTSMENGCLRSTIFLLQSLGLFKQAVEEALSKNDVALAKEVVNSDMIGIDTQRVLWLRIARHVITDKSNPQEATALLQESALLGLEDVFPLFPDFVTIDEFREIICASLDTYNSQIEQLKSEMRVTAESSNEIRTQLNNLKSHFELIPENARCSHCLYALALRTFYVFPCGHFFHTDCLMNLVRPHLAPSDAARLAALYARSETDGSVVQKFRSHFDELVAADCVLCGRIAVESVTRLYFADAQTYEAERKLWLSS